MYFLAIEDPQDPDNDLAKGSWNISKVQKAFDFAYRQLSNPIEPSESNLERIIRSPPLLPISKGYLCPLENQGECRIRSEPAYPLTTLHTAF
jgi:hypothetical protein